MSSLAYPKRKFALRLLGSFQLEEWEGKTAHPIRLPRRKVELLLAYLALYPEPAPHPREKLAALLWGDTPDEQARMSLRTSLAALRKALGGDALIADRDSVQLNPNLSLTVDVWEFSDTCGTDPEKAIDLYRGDLLEAFYEDWVLTERERLCSFYSRALLDLTEEMRSQSQYDRALVYARRLLASDASNETAHQHIMFCEMARGDRAAALKQYADCVQALRDEIGVSPSRETRALYQWLKQTVPPALGNASRRTNLPIPPTSFIGRKNELHEIQTLLAQAQLVTLVGAGGIGKTRLAIQVAMEQMDSWRDGVWCVDLSSLNAPALVPQAVAKALGVGETPQRSLTETLGDFLRSKQLLLLLDNCEHLIGASAELAAALLACGSSSRILATSREPLRTSGESLFQVPSLSVSDQAAPRDQLLMGSEGVRLFIERASAVQPGFMPNDEDLAHIVDICHRLDGIPLALELAAARVRALSVEQILSRLDDCFTWLTTGSRTALPRQQTLRALVDWSYDLLSDQERKLFRRLSVFAGGFTLEAAEGTVAGNGLATGQILDLLTSLVDKSLLVFQQKSPRYRMLATIRQYAAERLISTGQTEYWRERHCEWFTQWAEKAEPFLRGPDQVKWIEQLEADHSNLRVALEWASHKQDQGEAAFRLAGALARFWTMRGYWSEAHEWLAGAETSGATTCARAKALVGLADLKNLLQGGPASGPLYAASLALYRTLGDDWGTAFAASYSLGAETDPSRAARLFEESVALAGKLQDAWLSAGAHMRMGVHALRQQDPARARTLMEHALRYSREAGDQWMICSALANLGEIARARDDYASAGALYKEALAIQREMGDHMIPITLHNMGYVVLHQGDCAQADALFRESLTLHKGLGRKQGMSECLAGMGAVAAVRNQPERAVRLLSAARTWLVQNHAEMDPSDRNEFDSYWAAACAGLTPAAQAAAQQEGEGPMLEQAVELALREA